MVREQKKERRERSCGVVMQRPGVWVLTASGYYDLMSPTTYWVKTQKELYLKISK